MYELVRLFGDRRGERRMAVPESAGRNAGAEIKILTTFFIPHTGPLTLSEGEGEPSVSLENILAVFFDGGHEFLG